MTSLLTIPQEMFCVVLTMLLFAALVGDFCNARFFRSIRNTPSPWKDLAKDSKVVIILLTAFMAWAQDKDSLQSSGNGDWLSGSTLESMEGDSNSRPEEVADPQTLNPSGQSYSMMGASSTEGASGITWAMLSGLPPFTSNAVLTASQYLGGFACVGVTNIQPSVLDAPANAVTYTNCPYAVARQSVPLPQGCLPGGFTFGGRTVTNLYMSASGMLSFDGPKSSPIPSTNGIPDGTALNYISVLQTPSDIVPTNGIFWYAPGTNSSVFTWKDVFLGRDTNCLATVQAELYANGDFTCRYLFPAATNYYAQLTNAFLIGAQNNSGGETALYTNALLSIHPSFLPSFELRWKSLAGLDPNVPDFDSDGLSDADELFIYRTDPRRKDTDGDGIPDAIEIANGTDPLNPDENNDGIPDGVDLTGYSLSDTNLVFKLINGIAPGVDPLLDSDNDGWADWLELRFGTETNSVYSTPEYSDTLFSVTVSLASPPPEPGVLAVGTNRVMVTGPGSWTFWRISGEAHPVSFTSRHGVAMPPFSISFNRPTAARYDIPQPDGKGGDFGKAALPLISFDPEIGRCCHEATTEAHCQTYTAYVMPPMPGTYAWETYAWDWYMTRRTSAISGTNAVTAGHDIIGMRFRFTPTGASAYRETWVWINSHCAMAGVETTNPDRVSVNNNDDDADEVRDDTDTEITGGDPDLGALWPLGRFDGTCCQCPDHQPAATSATLSVTSEKIALYTDSTKANAFGGTIHAGEAVYVEGLVPSTEFCAEKLVWEWTEDNETRSITNALTVLSVRLFPDLDSDDDVDASDIAGLSSLSSEHGWLMPAATNVLRKLRLRTDVGLSGGAYTLSLAGAPGAFKVWADNSGTNAAPLLVSGQTITNGEGNVTFLAGEDTDLYVEAAGSGAATITYRYAGEGEADGITATASLTMTAIRIQIATSITNFCHTSASSSLHLTGDSFAGGQVEWSVSPSGLPLQGSTGASLTVYPSAGNIGTYTVTARSSALPSCSDTCTVNIIKIESVEASCDKFGASGSFGLNPVSFPGGDADFGEPDRLPPYWYIPGTYTSPSSRVLKVYFKYVKDANDEPDDFDIDLKADLIPGVATNAALNVTWSKLDGPASSGSFNQTDALAVKFQNPTKGGLYKFRAEAAPESGRSVHGDAWVLLPKAGGEIAGWMTTEVASVVAAAQAWKSAIEAVAISNNLDIVEFRYTAWLAIATADFDYQGVVGSPTQRYSFTDYDRPDWHYPNESIPGMAGSKTNGDWDEPSFATLRGIVVSRSKINNAMYAVWGRVLGYSTGNLKDGAYWNAASRGLWDDSTSQNAVVLGGALYDAFIANTSMDVVLTKAAAKGIQSIDSPTGLNDVNLWPDNTPVSTGFILYQMPTDYDSLKDGISTSPRGRFFQQ